VLERTNSSKDRSIYLPLLRFFDAVLTEKENIEEFKDLLHSVVMSIGNILTNLEASSSVELSTVVLNLTRTISTKYHSLWPSAELPLKIYEMFLFSSDDDEILLGCLIGIFEVWLHDSGGQQEYSAASWFCSLVNRGILYRLHRLLSLRCNYMWVQSILNVLLVISMGPEGPELIIDYSFLPALQSVLLDKNKEAVHETVLNIISSIAASTDSYNRLIESAIIQYMIDLSLMKSKYQANYRRLFLTFFALLEPYFHPYTIEGFGNNYDVRSSQQRNRIILTLAKYYEVEFKDSVILSMINHRAL
jgi:hypothetical protein